MPLLQTEKLLAESQFLQQQVATRAKYADKEDNFEPQQATALNQYHTGTDQVAADLATL